MLVNFSLVVAAMIDKFKMKAPVIRQQVAGSNELQRGAWLGSPSHVLE